MKSALIIDHDFKGTEEAVRLLRENGYTVEEAPLDDVFPEGGSHASDYLYRNILEDAPLGIFRSTPDGKFISVNSATASLLKYDSPEELMEAVNKRSIAEVLYTEPGRRREIVEDTLSQKGWHVFEVEYRCKDGSIITCKDYICMVPVAGGVMELVGFVEDISGRKKAEEELQMSKFMVDNASVAIFRGQEDARILYANEQAARMLGYSREELCSMTFFDIVPDMGEKRWKDHRRLLCAAGSRNIEALHRRKDGTIFPVEATINFMQFGKEEFSCTFTQDISERKGMEKILRESEELFRTLAEKSLVGVYIIQDDLFRYVNTAFAEIFGYAPEEIIGRLGPVDFLTPEDRERILDGVRLITAGGEMESAHHEFHISRKDGSIRVVEAFSSRALNQGRPAVIGTIIDITERKRWEEQLNQTLAQQRRISEDLQQANLVVENSPVVLFRWRAAPGWPVELVSKNVTQFGYTQEELLSGVVPFAAMVHPEDLERVASEVARHSAEGVDNLQQEYRIVAKNGEIHWVYDRTVSERDPAGKVTHYQGIVFDFTEQKIAEDTLRTSEERFRSLVETSSDWVWEIDSRGVYTYASPKIKDILGYDPDEIVGKTAFDLMPPEEAERMRARFAEIAASGGSFHGLESVNLHKCGHMVILETSGVPIFDANGKLSGFRGIDRDITSRKRAEEALRFTQFAIDNTTDQAFWATSDGRIFYVNNAACHALGYTREELLAMSIPDIAPQMTAEAFSLHWHDLQVKSSITLETVNRSKDGRVYPVEVRSNYVVFGGKEYNCAFVSDITERKRAEEELYFSKFCLERAPSDIVIFTREGKTILGANDHACESLGYSREELLTMSVFDIDPYVTPEKIKNIDTALDESGALTFEGTHRRKDGALFPVEITAKNLEYHGNNFVFTFAIDISERKRAEEKINEALAEKTVLLKEVHHRVKNNLQIISTLLDLQSEGIRDEAALAAFRESQDRIKAMALIHESLYESKDLASIDFQRYIEALSAQLFDSYLVDPGSISLQVDAGGVSIGIDQAIPCGLIINELVSNALKHAFPDNRPRVISIGFQREEDGRVSLRVADNGVGLPENLDINNAGTLGLQLLNTLARQLRGEVRIESGTVGTAIIIEFPEKWPK